MIMNPLDKAVDAHNNLIDAEGNMMFAVAGNAAFEPFDDELNTAVVELVCKASAAVEELSPRARRARLNLIWRDFVAEQKQRRSKLPLQIVGQ
jgi:hypothetical protein